MCEALQKIIEAMGINEAELARKLDIGRSSVRAWRIAGHIPATRVLQLEALSGVSRSTIRPDLYPIETTPRKKSRQK